MNIYVKPWVFIDLILIVIMFVTISCSKDCDHKIITCSEIPPTEELCQAFFKRWFYNQDKNICEEIGYSGCSQKGFANKIDCDVCKCK